MSPVDNMANTANQTYNKRPHTTYSPLTTMTSTIDASRERVPSPTPSSALSEDDFVDAHDGEDLRGGHKDTIPASPPTPAADATKTIEASQPEAPTPAGAPSPASAAASAAPEPARTPSPRPARLYLSPRRSSHTPSEGHTPMATAPTSPASPASPRTMTPATAATTPDPRPRLEGYGRPPLTPFAASAPFAPAPSAAPRSVSATMAHAFALAAQSDSDDDDDAPAPGLLDDDWSAFVQAQLVRLFPDFHDILEAQEAPSLRAEMQAMRGEIEVLRRVVAHVVQGPEAGLELDPVAMGLALAIVRAVDASRAGARPDAEVFAHDNLRALLAGVSTLVEATPATSLFGPMLEAAVASSTLDFESPPALAAPPSAPSPLSESEPLPSPPSLAPSPPSPTACPGPSSHTAHTTHPTHPSHALLDAHEQLEKAHDIAITPEIGTPPSSTPRPCIADAMCEEELEEVIELAEEAHKIVS
ncbi:hypothetical protein CC85DRAFT_303679 [Cutaneotrichosporon oleaginosum]|uniref:Uncharacterized protein n=1 Tax=Cutaneotrichosporon oleaginosum TaxID=879819 RepID=A0A0J0XIX2_9TREE|nr:uncharacterized protein CC85DRAFT_303679 [Cutaneotrichosporon oleaginosum]KLT41008.1 hypothetical protein CC85DRAFT_303679 [Cutaneotrichosporon oleaginosum]TXT06273.1 hypothetical protein COLE_05604 [Cutaneotrichosporon oleaginosum]